MIAATEAVWPQGLAHALISSSLTTVEVNHILATGVIPTEPKEQS